MAMPTVVTGISFVSVKTLPQVADIVECSRRLLVDRGAVITPQASRRYGFFLGTTFSNFAIRKANTEKYFSRGVRPINPADFPKGLISYLGGESCTALGIKGFNITFSSGVSSGVDALMQGVYFAARHKGNRALVLTLHEALKSNARIGFSGISGIMVEAAPLCERSYAEIMGFKSVFEKAGDCEGLQKLITAAVTQYRLHEASLMVACSGRSRGSIGSRLFERIRASYPMVETIKSPVRGGISELLRIVKKKIWLKEKYILFSQLGENSNSGCVVLRVSKRGGYPDEKKFYQKKCA
ncbi:MAG: hypothetical protein ABH865_03240 [Candidatus Omnitrophota bacterium]